MAKKDHRSEAALAAAERLFKRKPDASTEEFRKVCEKADKKVIGKLTNREFNASYVLPYRRSKALKGRPKRATERGGKRATQAVRGRGGRRAATAHQKVARMIRERDMQIMEAADDPRKMYEVASRVEEFAAEIASVVGRR